MSFKSWQSYWTFRNAVTNSCRFIFDEETKQFLATVLETSQPRRITIKSGAIFWRSQLGGTTRPIYDDDGKEISEEPCPHPVERMKPLRFLATEGRANPKGIPYLYLATSKETAMSEVRPWIGSEISVAQFKIKNELKIVDLSKNHLTNPFYFDSSCGIYEPSDEDKEKSVWTHIDKAFSEPVVKNDNRADYAPTQIISELFKNDGVDGVAYKSMLSDGYNVVLFNPEVAEIINCFLYVAKNVIFEFGEAANPYFVQSKQET